MCCVRDPDGLLSAPYLDILRLPRWRTGNRVDSELGPGPLLHNLDDIGLHTHWYIIRTV